MWVESGIHGRASSSLRLGRGPALYLSRANHKVEVVVERAAEGNRVQTNRTLRRRRPRYRFLGRVMVPCRLPTDRAIQPRLEVASLRGAYILEDLSFSLGGNPIEDRLCETKRLDGLFDVMSSLLLRVDGSAEGI